MNFKTLLYLMPTASRYHYQLFSYLLTVLKRHFTLCFSSDIPSMILLDNLYIESSFCLDCSLPRHTYSLNFPQLFTMFSISPTLTTIVKTYTLFTSIFRSTFYFELFYHIILCTIKNIDT